MTNIDSWIILVMVILSAVGIVSIFDLILSAMKKYKENQTNLNLKIDSMNTYKTIICELRVYVKDLEHRVKKLEEGN
jgi:hypothetical protein